MTKYAFVIDQRKCIGCHACTVACKAEHDVPIGVNRTWVKYIERGEFPNSRRYFLVNRCNHCDDAPCVKICPTKALYKRADGIVDFDSNRCIGCKSCMQACPYDALYIDPNSHTAAKCNYCAHRTETGMEPACVVVCPEHAIIAGDMHNPQTEIAQIIAREPVRVRKPEQGTGPNVYYLGADEATINPEAAVQELPHMTMWGTLLRPHHEQENTFNPTCVPAHRRTITCLAGSCTAVRATSQWTQWAHTGNPECAQTLPTGRRQSHTGTHRLRHAEKQRSLGLDGLGLPGNQVHRRGRDDDCRFSPGPLRSTRNPERNDAYAAWHHRTHHRRSVYRRDAGFAGRRPETARTRFIPHYQGQPDLVARLGGLYPGYLWRD